MEGLGYTNNMYRCFVKKNPMVAVTTTGQAVRGKDDAGRGDNTNTLINSKDKVAGDPTSGNKAERESYVSAQRLTCNAANWGPEYVFKRSCGENLSYYQCVYVNKCCYKPTVSNEPACYRPELSKAVTTSQAYVDAKANV